MIVMVVSSFTFTFEATAAYKLQSLGLGTAATQFLLTQLILISKRASFDDLVLHLRRVYNDIKDLPGSVDIINLGDKRSRSFTVIFSVVIFSNLPLSVFLATIKMLMTGSTTYPFEMSVFGLPTAIGWVFQMVIATCSATVIAAFYIIIRIVIYVLDAYCTVLAHMLRERPVDADAKSDRKFLRLFCNISSLTQKLVNIYGLTALIEVYISSGRCCFLAYHCLLAVENRDYDTLMSSLPVLLTSVALTLNLCWCGEDIAKLSEAIGKGIMESKWYACSPPARRTLLPLIMYTERPIRFHYKRFVYFNMEAFGNVLKTTYTMTTAVSQVRG